MPGILNFRFLATGFFAFASIVLAQEFRATLNGRVIDTQGAVVPGAKISVVNQESQARTETVAGPNGFYNIFSWRLPRTRFHWVLPGGRRVASSPRPPRYS